MPAVQLKPIPHLPSEARAAIAAFGARTTWPAGFTIYEHGASADGVFIVARGQVVLRTQIGSGRTFVPWVATAGETFGAEGLESDAEYATSARAEVETDTLHLSASRFSALLREQPARALALIRQLTTERTALLEKFAQYATLSVEQRLITALLRLTRPTDGQASGARTGTVVSRRLLGELVGATRESISLVLSRLTSEGLVQRSGNGLRVLSAQGLLERLSGSAPNAAIPLFDERHATVQHIAH